MTIRTAVWRSIAWLAAGMAVGLPLLGFSGSDRAVGYYERQRSAWAAS